MLDVIKKTMITISPFEIEYEIWVTGAYLQTRIIKTFYCYTDNKHTAINMWEEFLRPYTMFVEYNSRIIKTK